jgi:hypothetical protein
VVWEAVVCSRCLLAQGFSSTLSSASLHRLLSCIPEPFGHSPLFSHSDHMGFAAFTQRVVSAHLVP